VSKIVAERRNGFVAQSRGGGLALGAGGAVLWLLRGLVALLLCFKVFLVYRININWDEFVYLAHVLRFQDGEHLPLIQTFYVHPFAWLASLPGFEMEKLQAARLAVAALGTASAGLIYAIARRYLSELAVLAALLLYLADPNLLKHAYSFRADTLCAFLFLAAVYCFLSAEKHRILAALGGAALAVSALISVKTVFFALPLACLVCGFLWRDGRRALGRIAVFAVAFALAFGMLLAWHSLALNGVAVADQVASAGTTANRLQGIFEKVLLQTGFFPRWREFLVIVAANPMLWLALLGGLALAVNRLLRKGFGEAEVMVIAACSLLLPLLLYRNAFSYFYVFLLPLPTVAAGYFLERLFRALPARRSGDGRDLSLGSALATGCVICLLALPTWAFAQAAYLQASDNQRGQREIIDLVHRAFPEPVPYIDRNSMIATFPKVGFFMSTWGVEGYRGRGEPLFRDVLERDGPRFLLVNTPMLDIGDPAWFGEDESVYRLLDEDYEVLRDNFVPYWGALYVLGKRFEALDSAPVPFEILVPGDYEVRGDNPVMIDGLPLLPGDIASLAAGAHAIRMPSGRGTVVLREAGLPDAPAAPPSGQPIYDGL